MNAVDEYTFHPFIHSFSNHRSRQDLLSPASIPDVLPTDLGSSRGDFSFAAGDFVEIYGAGRQTGKMDLKIPCQEDTETFACHTLAQWDSVVTCFFIDTVS
jgi:carnosine N-methyltransferase